jgi:DNA-binding NarL/FixJ family response regulator
MAAATERIRVLIVDDHPMLRDGVAMLVNRQPDMVVVGEACDGQQALEQFRALRPDITLMDLQMPAMDGLVAVRHIRREFPAARIIVLTTYKGDVQVHDALAAGVAGYLLKDMARKELARVVRDVHAGKRVVPPEIAAELAAHMTDERLTSRELDVLRLVAIGLSNKLIAERLDITEDTVKSHMRGVLAKLQANDRTHAVTIAVKRGIIAL